LTELPTRVLHKPFTTLNLVNAVPRRLDGENNERRAGRLTPDSMLDGKKSTLSLRGNRNAAVRGRSARRSCPAVNYCLAANQLLCCSMTTRSPY
jgi:hypothetical protein